MRKKYSSGMISNLGGSLGCTVLALSQIQEEVGAVQFWYYFKFRRESRLYSSGIISNLGGGRGCTILV